MTRWLPAIALMFLAVAPIVLVDSHSSILAFQSTPEPTAPLVIANEVLGHTVPVNVDDPELALGRVTIMPGAAIPLHHHPGAQIGVIVQGTLTYIVYLSTLFPAGAPRAILDAATPTP